MAFSFDIAHLKLLKENRYTYKILKFVVMFTDYNSVGCFKKLSFDSAFSWLAYYFNSNTCIYLTDGLFFQWKRENTIT